MVQQQRNNSKTSCDSNSKSSQTIISRVFLALSSVFLIQCSTTTQTPSSSLKPQSIQDSDGTLYQLTFSGENEFPSYSKAHNKIVYSKKNHSDLRQIYELDISTHTEKRITYNIGDNTHPLLHPYKLWIAYSSSKDEQVEKISIQKLMKEYGLSESPLMENELGYEVYVSSLEGTDVQRLTQSKGYDGHPAFSSDGNRLYFLKRNSSTYEIIESNSSQKKLKILFNQKKPIIDFSINSQYLAIVSKINDKDFEIQIFSLKNFSKPIYSFLTTKEIQSISLDKDSHRILISASLDEDQNLDIYEIDFETKCKKRITSNPEQDQSPIYGNSSTVIIFTSQRSGHSHVYTKSLDANLPCNTL